jgi:hypothetical protein
MIGIFCKGEYTSTIKKLKNAMLNRDVAWIMDKYGRIGVERLSAATPVRTGLTADSWSYKVENQNEGYKLTFSNSNTSEGIPIIVFLRYGHVTSTGGWVEGNDFVKPIIDQLLVELQEEF